MRSSSRRAAAALLTASVLVLAACSSGSSGSTTSKERTTDDNVAFTSCSAAKCTGELDGAAYEIVMPAKWNGTLLLYSHGYRQPKASPPDFKAPTTTAEPAPGWPKDKSVGQALLDKGYAIAGSAYASNGWAVSDGVKADEALHKYFVDTIAQPYRTLAWGDSLGGLVTELLAEKHPDWVSGAAPLCGPLAGPNDNLDLALQAGVALKALFVPDLKLTGYASYDEAVAAWTSVATAIQKAASDIPAGPAKIAYVAGLIDASGQTRTQDGADLTSQVTAYAETILTGLGYGTFGRYDIEQRVGGNPSTDEKIDFPAEISASEAQLVNTLVPGGVDTYNALVQAEPRIQADPAARAKFAATGTPTGAVKDPTITLHTKADPLVLVQNETVFASRVSANPKRTADLVQLYTLPPATYTKAPYGAGHCNFTKDSRVGVVSLLDTWVRTGAYPGADAVPPALGPDSGYNAVFKPGPWPAVEQ